MDSLMSTDGRRYERPRRAAVAWRAHDYQFRSAWLDDTVLFRDELDSRLSPRRRRYFWLVDIGVQLVYDSYGWAGEWRVDLVDIEREDRRMPAYHVRDMALDVVVEGFGPTYRMLDLDDLGRRLLTGEFTPCQVSSVLSRAQAFLDRYLHRGAPWPPPEVRPHFAPDHHYPKPR